MAINQENHESQEHLDRLGSGIVRLASSNELNAEAVASSPFLYARVRARIAAERTRREEGENWLALFNVFWRTIPAMTLVAVMAFALFWSASSRSSSTITAFNDDSFLDANDAGISHVVFADRRPLSSDEVLATIINEDEREDAR